MRPAFSFWKFLRLVLTLASLPAWVGAAAADSGQFHCAGFAQLTADTNLTALHTICALPSAGEMRELILSRISRLWAADLQPKASNAAGPLEPLLADVLQTESVGSFGGLTASPADFTLALRLDAPRMKLWRDNLEKVFGGPGEKFTAEEFNGWRWQTSASDTFWIVPAGDWLIAGRGPGSLPAQGQYLRAMRLAGRPAPPLTTNWLEADLDWPCLTHWWPGTARLMQPARLNVAISPGSDNLYLTARVSFRDAVPWKPGVWQTPVQLVPSPLISFTAGQDIAAFLNLDPMFSRLDGNPLTNQFYVWAQEQMPFLSYMAWPVANATNALKQLSTNAPAAFNAALRRFNGTALVWQPAQKKLVLAKLRVMAPSLEAAPGKDGDFLLEGLFPRLPVVKPAPAGLWQQIGQSTNLVYYDWESTGPRLQQWRLLGRILLIPPRVLTDEMSDAMRVEDQWLEKSSPFLGNTITRITRDTPKELSIARSSSAGLTGIELFFLADWLSRAGSLPVNPRPAAH